MVKINSIKWAKKDDPMFTGRFHVHSVRGKDSGQRKKKKGAGRVQQHPF